MFDYIITLITRSTGIIEEIYAFLFFLQSLQSANGSYQWLAGAAYKPPLMRYGCSCFESGYFLFIAQWTVWSEWRLLNNTSLRYFYLLNRIWCSMHMFSEKILRAWDQVYRKTGSGRTSRNWVLLADFLDLRSAIFFLENVGTHICYTPFL